MKLIPCLWPLFLVLLTSCDFLNPDVDDDDDFDFGPDYDCQYVAKSTYYIGADVESDFSELNVAYDVEVTSTDCSGINVGDVVSGDVQQIERVGADLTVYNGGMSETINISGTDVSGAESASGCESGIYISGEMTDGYLDTVNDDVVMEFSYRVDLNYCSSFNSYDIRFGRTSLEGPTKIGVTGFLLWE